MKVLLKAAVAGSIFALGGMLIQAGSAQASGHTDLGAELTPGVLSIAVPASYAYGSQEIGGAGDYLFTAQIGQFRVTDDRGLLDADWAVSAISTALVNSNVGDTILPSDMAYTTGSLTMQYGVGTSNGAAVAGNHPLDAPVTVAAKTLGQGVNEYYWNPTVAFTAPFGTIADTYLGTLTTSVS